LPEIITLIVPYTLKGVEKQKVPFRGFRGEMLRILENRQN